MKRNLLIACCYLGWAASAAGAPLTLDACLQRADQRSSVIKSFEMALQAADESLTISRTFFYPTLKLKAAYSLADNPQRLIIAGNSFMDRVPPQDVTLSTGDRGTYNIGLFLQQPLYTGGNLTNSRRRAEFHVEAAQSDTTYQRSLMVQTVKKTFSEALAARLQVQALHKSLAGAKEQARVVRERLLEGHARREELFMAEAEVSKAEANWMRGENQAEIILTTLRKLINAAPHEPIEPIGSLRKIHLTVSLSELLTLGVQNRADLKSVRAKVQQGETDIAIARSGYFPQVSLTGSYQRQPETANMRANVWTVGAQAEWSLFEWGRTAAEVRLATARAQQEVFRQVESRKDALLEIEQFWRDMKDGEGHLRAVEAQLISQEYTLERVLNRFQEGFVKRADTLQTEATFWNAYAAYIQSAANLHKTLASLERASGMELTPWIEYTLLYEPAFSDSTAQVDQTAHPKLPLSEPSVTTPATVIGEKQVTHGP